MGDLEGFRVRDLGLGIYRGLGIRDLGFKARVWDLRHKKGSLHLLVGTVEPYTLNIVQRVIKYLVKTQGPSHNEEVNR